MRIFLLLVGALLAVGCGANPTDSQVAQAMQATRDDLKLPPEERRVETLSVNKAVELAARENPGELPGPRVAGELPNTPEEVQRAREIAQEGALLRIADKEEEAIEKLYMSLEIAPTFDAVEALAPLLIERGEIDELNLVCEQVYRSGNDRELDWQLFESCSNYEGPLEAKIPWASQEDRDSFIHFKP